MRRRTASTLVLLAALACACATPTVAAPPSSPTLASPPPTARPETPTAAAVQVPDCYYVWSSQDLPELSGKFNRELRAADPVMTGSAYAFGEDCVGADTSRKFIPMETDFRIQVAVDDLSDKERMGNAIGNAMAVVGGIPPSQLEGPQPGRAEFEFITPASDSLRLNVDIAGYTRNASRLHGAELFDALQSVQ